VQSITSRAQTALQKVAMKRPPKQEVNMRLVTRIELAAKNESELHGLLRNAFNELAKSNPYTYQRRSALASIENIQRAITSRAPCP